MHLVRHVPVHQQVICIGLAIAHHSCFHSYRLALLGQKKKKDSDVVTDGTVGWRRRKKNGGATTFPTSKCQQRCLGERGWTSTQACGVRRN